ncbi:MAG: hypothetical protein GX268_01640 [Methanomicrobiales archaeon]|nr:hypothetical protein [Methanomicrobiales archaeon]
MVISHKQKIALALAYSDGEVTHKRNREMSGIHPSDLTKDLKVLVDLGFLVPEGESRGRVYYPKNPPQGMVIQSHLTDEKGDSNLSHLDPSLSHSENVRSLSLMSNGSVPLAERIERGMRMRNAK